ncbi:MAG: ion transporter [Pseudomonadota bacterium]
MAVQQLMTQIGLRKRLYRELEPDARENGGLSRTNLLIVLLVLASFIALALETEPSLSPAWKRGIDLFNYVIIAIFAVEYGVRLWAAGEDPRFSGLGGRLKYILSPSALADLIAFLPELLWIVFIGTEGDQALMILRILRLTRLVKIARFMPAFDVLGAALSRSRGQLFTTLAVALVLVYLSAVLLYFIEGVSGGREEFGSIPRAVWWAIATLTTVGYGDVYPETTLGRIAASFIALAGIGVVALPAGVFASAFSDELREREEARREAAAKRNAMGLVDDEKPAENAGDSAPKA